MSGLRLSLCSVGCGFVLGSLACCFEPVDGGRSYIEPGTYFDLSFTRPDHEPEENVPADPVDATLTVDEQKLVFKYGSPTNRIRVTYTVSEIKTGIGTY